MYGESTDLVGRNIFDIEARIATPKGTIRIIIDVKNTDRIAPLREVAQQVKQLSNTRNAIPFVASSYLGNRAREDRITQAFLQVQRLLELLKKVS